jgi:ParB-like chromosome segregation protein Spo0J
VIEEIVEIGLLSADPANVRLHKTRNLRAIMASLARFGQQRPIVADRNGTIRAGNGRYLAAKELGWSHLKVVWTDLAGADATAYAIAANRTAELATWKRPTLAATLEALEDDGIELADIGFTADELAALQPLEATEEPLEPGEVRLKFNLIFDDGAQQARWFNFVRHLNTHEEGETLSARLDHFLADGCYMVPA